MKLSTFFLTAMAIAPAESFTVNPPSRCMTLTSNSFTPQVRAETHLAMVGNFAGQDKMNAELASFPKLGSTTSSSSDNNVVFNGLVDYLGQWSKAFDEDPKSMKLTTPVELSQAEPNSSASGDTNIVKSEGIKLVFKDVSTGYKNKSEEDAGDAYRASKPTSTPDENKEKAEDKKEGGVEILVEQLEDGSVQVRARRCETDENTMVKEMSEETITNELKKAMKVWSQK